MPQPTVDTPAPASAVRIQELLAPEVFPHPVSDITLRETHISWVILTGPFAYKIKKAVKFDFIDSLTLERRRHLCEEELRLNRRFAPDLYVNVAAITRKNGSVEIGGDGAAIEYAVRMQQFSPSDELPALLAREDVKVTQIEALAESLARFHLNAALAAPAQVPAKTELMYQSVFGNLAQLLAHCSGEHSSALNRLIDWTHDTAQALESAFEARERGGFVRECHGDLHAANIVRWHGQLVPFDGIDFEPKLRWIDVISDIAFLVMDLASHERNDLAFALLSRYLEVTGDYDGLRVLPFYAAYRALVRAKVDALAAEQLPAQAAESHQRLQRRIRAAMTWTTPRQPMLMLMHGASGSGKSWLSRQLVPALGAIRIRSDLERKRLAGIETGRPAAARVREGIYSPHFSHRTYGRMADCAEICLRAGFDVVVDAAFLEATDRELFSGLAERAGARRVIVSCQAERTTLAERILERSAGRSDPSDATLNVLDMQLRDLKPFDLSEQPDVVAVDTGKADALATVVAAIRARLPT
jgi:uncharacterized protein